MVAAVVAVLSVRLLVLPMVSVVQVDQYGDGPDPSVLWVGVVAQVAVAAAVQAAFSWRCAS